MIYFSSNKFLYTETLWLMLCPTKFNSHSWNTLITKDILQGSINQQEKHKCINQFPINFNQTYTYLCRNNKLSGSEISFFVLHSDDKLHIHYYAVFFHLGKNDPLLMDMPLVIWMWYKKTISDPVIASLSNKLV